MKVFRIYIVVFFGILAAACIGTLWNFLPSYQKTTPARALSPLFKDFARQFEEAVPLRNSVIYYNNYIKLKYFNVSPAPIMAMGKEGWRFLNKGPDAIDISLFHQSLKPLSADELRRWKEKLEERNAWAANQNIGFVFMVAPEKSTIYQEYLQGAFKRIGTTTRYDQLMEYMKHYSAVPVLDLRPMLNELKGKVDEPIYFKSGAHWNDFSVYRVYKELCSMFHIKDCFTMNDVTVEHINNLDSLYMNLNVQDIFPSQDVHFVFNKEMPITKTMKEWGWVTTNPAAKNQETIFVSGDSFGDYIFAFLTHDFRKTVYIAPSYYSQDVLDKRIAEEGKPKFLLKLIAERYLMNPHP